MFRIKTISALQFRNYASDTFHFDEKVTAICGKNGAGKTNLLDAVHFLCLTKSYFGKSDLQSVQHGAQGFRINGLFERKEEEIAVELILRESAKKELRVDSELVSVFSQHIGKLPLVFIAPDDISLIAGGSEERRKLIDSLLSQLDADYLHSLIRYNRSLLERNKYLKSTEPYQLDHALLDAFDQQLVQWGTLIDERRSAFFQQFIPKVAQLYGDFSSQMERPSITHVRGIPGADFSALLQSARQKDIFSQRTTIGIHRDDLLFEMDQLPFKLVASQGQKKSLLFALKLACFQLLTAHNQFEPILLLDDVFEKLDADRLNQLLKYVTKENNGQVLLTDTHADRMRHALDNISVPYQSITI